MTAGMEAPTAAWCEGLGTIEISARVTPVMVGLAMASLGVACFGAFSASSLLVYSPTKLGKRYPDAAGERMGQELASHLEEYQVVARFFALFGLVGAFLAIQTGVDDQALPWALGGVAALALFFCGVLPAAVAERAAEATVVAAFPWLRMARLALRWPIVLPIVWVTRGTMRLCGIRSEPTADRAEVAEEVIAAVTDSVTDDVLAAEEKAWIGNIVGLKDLVVSTIMTPRTDIVGVSADTPLQEAVALALHHGFSRYPVYQDRLDNVVGMFYVKDALALTQEAAAGRTPGPRPTVQSMMREPLFVPETMAVGQLLRKFQTRKVHLAIVLDEYGGTAGLVSVEDVLEQIVGDIADEYDAADTKTAAEESVHVIEAGRVVELSARTPVGEVNQLLGTHLPEDGDWETIAGFVIAHCNRIPAVGETIATDGVEFRILAADDRRLARLRVTALHGEPAAHNG